MNFQRLKYLLLTVSALCSFSRIVPAQTQLPPLPVDSRIQKGTLGSGVTYYMVTDPAVKGYADIAVVQRDEPLSAAKREGLRSTFLGRMEVSPGSKGYVSDVDGSTVYRFEHIPFYRPQVLDSTLLYTFALVAQSKAQQAVIVSGDIDAPELKKKMDIFSMLVPRMLVKENHRPDYVWEPSPAPSVQFRDGREAMVSVTYSCSRIPFPFMNTAQALVTDLFAQELRILLWHRLERALREAGIAYGDIGFTTLRSEDYGGDERYTVRVTVAPDQHNAAMRVISATLAEMDSYGVSTEEFIEAKKVLLPAIHRKAEEIPSPSEYVSRCIAHFLYGANLAPYSETLRLFARKNVPDSTETRLFNNFSGALLDQLGNLTLEYTDAPDSLDKDQELFYYNLSYLYGSVIPTGNDYSWRGADTLGLPSPGARVKVRSEKKEAITGSTLWTFSNGMRVCYKQVPGSGIFHYALQLNGGLSRIEGLREGEGGYIGEMLPLYDAAGLRAWHFREVLEAAGISMETRVDLNGMAIGGAAPSSQFPMLLKVLLELANNRIPNQEEFEAYSRRESVRGVSMEALLEKQLTPDYPFATRKDPSVLSLETWKKAEKYFAGRFSRMNDGILIVSGDLDAEVVKKMLCRYLGGFRVVKGTTPRKPVDYRPRSGTETVTGEGPVSGIHILMDAEYGITSDQYYIARIGAEALRQKLVQKLAGYGFSCDVRVSEQAQPQERFQLWITCLPLPLQGLPGDVEEVSAQRALTAVRAAIREVSEKEVDPADLAHWKAKLEGETATAIASSAGFVNTLFARYAVNKDVTSRYRESISGISWDKVRSFLETMAGGGRVEYIVP